MDWSSQIWEEVKKQWLKKWLIGVLDSSRQLYMQ